MGHIRSKRLGLYAAMVLTCGSLLVACTGEPPKPAPVVGTNASSTPVGEIGTPVVSESPVVAAPFPGRGNAMRQASQPRPVREIRTSKHVVSAKERHRTVKARHQKGTKHVAHKATARKHAKVTGIAKTIHPET